MEEIKNQLSKLNKISKMSVALYHKFALHIGISDSCLGVLYALFESNEPCSQYDLCSKWFIPKQTINSAVSVLQKKGFISLSAIQGTRNKKNIVLTELGKSFTEQTIGKLREIEISSLEELSPSERKQFVCLNQKYNEVLTKKLGSIFKEL